MYVIQRWNQEGVTGIPYLMAVLTIRLLSIVEYPIKQASRGYCSALMCDRLGRYELLEI